ncbi:hypothetical protein ACIA8K_38910 [Catenuloplanes sp. NPDC051500]|uniref:hypothetical protein n=1 Tax=Catenuloplanes sp. NPDC051500 TaxID=3363959 RepID=UPI00378A8DFF
MSPSRSGRGRPINQQRWPGPGPWRDWLIFCDRLHRANGLPSLRKLSPRTWTSPGRVGEILRGEALPADERQAAGLLEALGAVAGEVDRGMRLFALARAAADRAARPETPDWWLRCGYTGRISQLAPLTLVSREVELRELARWCTHADETYVRWQAGPRAGKSGLMSWLVLHPPPGVWMLSFFVTARHAGQADNTAFIDALLDQLAALTGEPSPSSAAPVAREGAFHRLLEKAALLAVRKGHRLVLLVDGADEDCGGAPGSGLPSIASCLPKRPPRGLQVLVAARPDPPMPVDVDHDHPLRSCRVRTLDTSPHARRIVELAEAEIDEILSTERARHDGLGYEVLGLVAASGGGLSSRDLRQLTGQAPFALDALLRGMTGRTIARRGGRPDTEQVFLFTHETLQVKAVERLGADILAVFRGRIHDWASGFQQRGWPPETPTYLLHGYPSLLRERGDLPRLADLATDPARHDRLLAVTGGDAVALAENAAAHALLCRRPDPDLLTALRLAWHRDGLAGRNADVPDLLPAVWAALGQHQRAGALARSLTDPVQRAYALSRLADVAVAGGGGPATADLVAEAVAVADHITDLDRQSDTLTRLAVTTVVAGDYDGAERIARTVADVDRRALALTDVAMIVEAAGHHDRAGRIVGDLGDPISRAQAWMRLARIGVAAGRYDRAAACAMQAESLINPQPGTLWKAKTLGRLAVMATETGRHDRAGVLLVRAEDVRAGLDTANVPQSLSGLIGLLGEAAVAGYWQRVIDLAVRVEARIQSLQPVQRATLLTELALTFLRAGDRDRAAELIGQAETQARAIDFPPFQSPALAAVSEAVALIDGITRAEVLVRAIADPSHQNRALVRLTTMTAASGDWDTGERIAGAISDPGWHALALARMAQAAVGAGHLEQAAAYATEAEILARSVRRQRRDAVAATGVAAAVAALARYAQAEAIADAITNRDKRIRTLAGLAEAADTDGDVGTTARLIAKAAADAHAGAGDAEATFERLIVLVKTALAVRDDRAGQLAETAEASAGGVLGSYGQLWALVRLAEVTAAGGVHATPASLIDRATELAQAETDPYDQARAAERLARTAMVLGSFDQAEAMVLSITDQDRYPAAVAGLAAEAAACGQHAMSARLATEARTTAHLTNDPYERAATSTSLAMSAARLGRHDQMDDVIAQAQTYTRSIDNPDLRSVALIELLGVAIAAERLDQAEALIGGIVIPNDRAEALSTLAAALTAAHQHDRAAAVARSIIDPDRQAAALTCLADVLEPRQAADLLIEALAVGPWPGILPSIARVDAATLLAFVDEVWDRTDTPDYVGRRPTLH